MQPIHSTQDMLAADALWGPRSADVYAWRSLLDAGAVVAFGSDSPVEDLDVMKGIHAAVPPRRRLAWPGGRVPCERSAWRRRCMRTPPACGVCQW